MSVNTQAGFLEQRLEMSEADDIRQDLTDDTEPDVDAVESGRLRSKGDSSSYANGALSISAGVAGMAISACSTGHELLAQADRALYAAKRAGKNRVGMQPGAAASCGTHHLPSNPAA